MYLAAAGPMLVTAFSTVAGASPWWLMAGLASTASSMIVFALLRRQTLAVGGARISRSQAVAVSYGAGAVHTTVPAGAVFSTTYTFRHLRSRGASAAAVTWSMTITGVLSTLTLSAVGLLGLLLSTGGSVTAPALSISAALMILLGLVATGRSPSFTRLAHRTPIGTQRLWRRIGWLSKIVDELSKAVQDLRNIHPSGRDLLLGVSLALLNWVLDLGCLAACCTAVGVQVSPAALLITFTTGMAAGSLLPVPAGLGAVETAMTLTLTVAGATASPALAAALLFRLLSTGSVVLIGWLVIAAQQLRTASPAWPGLAWPNPRLPLRDRRHHQQATGSAIMDHFVLDGPPRCVS